MKRILAIGVILLFIGISFSPSLGKNNEYIYSITKIDKNGVNITLNGTLGDNGWYISCVRIIIEIHIEIEELYYQIDNTGWQVYTGGPFIICEDGEHTFCYYYIDINGNQSEIECIDFKIDQTKPKINLTWYAYVKYSMWHIIMIANCSDTISAMNRVEFNLNDIWYDTIVGPGPIYEWLILPLKSYQIVGFICNRKIIEENISFFGVWGLRFMKYYFNYTTGGWVTAYAFDNAGNLETNITEYIGLPFIPKWSPIWFDRFTFENNYVGFLGRFFINAIFEKGPLLYT